MVFSRLKTRISIFVVVAAAVLVLVTLYLCKPDVKFVALADDYIDHFYLPTNPSLSTSLGVHRYDDQLEDYSSSAVAHNIAQLQAYETKFQAVNPRQLTEQNQGNLELLQNNIRGSLLNLQKIQNYKKNPDFYPSVLTNAAFVLMERQFAPAQERLRTLIAREKRMPAFLREGQENLINPPRIYTSIALEQLPGIIRFFQKDVPAAFAGVKDEDLRRQFAESNARVIQALQAYQSWLQKDLLPRSNGDFRLGQDIFRQKLRYDEMVDLSLNDLLAIGMANLRHNQEALLQVAKEINPNKTPTQVLKDLARDYPSPDTLLATFNNSLASLIDFIQRKHIITIPSQVRPTLEETPPFLRAITFASMDIPGPFERSAHEAYFNVTLPEKSWGLERVKEFMAEFNYPVISIVSVHEAYPGHYVQFLWLQDNRDRIRKIFGASSNAEGWAHYCEQMMLDEGLGQEQGPRQAALLRLGYLQEALLRNARYIVGIQMHAGNMSFEQAQDFFVKQAYQTKAVALVETKRGTMDPTYLYYTLGKLEILKLRADLEKKQGAAFKLEQFHNDFMRQGYPPLKIVRKALLGDDSPVL